MIITSLVANHDEQAFCLNSGAACTKNIVNKEGLDEEEACTVEESLEKILTQIEGGTRTPSLTRSVL